MTPEEFQSRWQELPSSASTTELEACQVVNGSGVWIARDHADRQHLLVRVPDGTAIEVSGTHGLNVSIGRNRIAARYEATYIDLVCLEPAAATTFAAVAADIADEAVTADPDDRCGQVVAVLGEWRWFWSVDPTGLSASDALGLFGELWFLLRWAGVLGRPISAWDASNGARHDFQWSERSVEVKVTSRAGAVVHAIQHLEQLADPESGDLYIYSLRVGRDALGVNSLNGLVDAVTRALSADPVTRAELLDKLSRRATHPQSAITPECVTA